VRVCMCACAGVRVRVYMCVYMCVYGYVQTRQDVRVTGTAKVDGVCAGATM